MDSSNSNTSTMCHFPRQHASQQEATMGFRCTWKTSGGSIGRCKRKSFLRAPVLRKKARCGLGYRVLEKEWDLEGLFDLSRGLRKEARAPGWGLNSHLLTDAYPPVASAERR